MLVVEKNKVIMFDVDVKDKTLFNLFAGDNNSDGIDMKMPGGLTKKIVNSKTHKISDYFKEAVTSELLVIHVEGVLPAFADILLSSKHVGIDKVLVVYVGLSEDDLKLSKDTINDYIPETKNVGIIVAEDLRLSTLVEVDEKINSMLAEEREEIYNV